jgi:hypothetical protein
LLDDSYLSLDDSYLSPNVSYPFLDAFLPGKRANGGQT